MPSSIVEGFINRLLESEATGRPEPVADAFPRDARLERPVRDSAERLAPLEFWRGYLESFDQVRSEFTRISEADGFASLEWVSHATLPGGRRIDYRGVTLLEHDGGTLRAMRTYYDSAPFAAEAVTAAARSRRGRVEPDRGGSGGERDQGRTGGHERKGVEGPDRASGRGGLKGDTHGPAGHDPAGAGGPGAGRPTE